MNTTNKAIQTKHQELLALLNPLIDYMTDNNFTFFVVAGKDGTCTRHLRGETADFVAMVSGMMRDNETAKLLLLGACDAFFTSKETE